MNLTRRSLVLVASDALMVMVVIGGLRYLRFPSFSNSDHVFEIGTLKAIVVVLVLLSTSFLIETHNPCQDFGWKGIVVKILMALVLCLLAFSFLFVTLNLFSYNWQRLAGSALAYSFLQFLTRSMYRTLEISARFAHRILIIGAGPLASQLGKLIEKKHLNYVIIGYLQCLNEPYHVPAEMVLGTTSQLGEVISSKKPNKILVALSERRGVFPLREVMDCKLKGIEVVDAPSFYEQITGKLLLEGITPSWFIYSEGFEISRQHRISKRFLDVACSFFGIIVALPLFPLIALAIKIDSKGPIFFRQERVGKGEAVFTLFKFRTMLCDAEKETGAVWAKEDDERITRIGRWLRKSRIDEIPQLLNVFRGEMSLIGPRPERKAFVEKLKEIIPYYSERHLAKPGVTGWAQVRYQYGASAEDAIEKLRYDLYYIKNGSILLDLVILLETIGVVIYRKGAR